MVFVGWLFSSVTPLTIEDVGIFYNKLASLMIDNLAPFISRRGETRSGVSPFEKSQIPSSLAKGRGSGVMGFKTKPFDASIVVG